MFWSSFEYMIGQYCPVGERLKRDRASVSRCMFFWVSRCGAASIKQHHAMQRAWSSQSQEKGASAYRPTWGVFSTAGSLFVMAVQGHGISTCVLKLWECQCLQQVPTAWQAVCHSVHLGALQVQLDLLFRAKVGASRWKWTLECNPSWLSLFLPLPSI